MNNERPSLTIYWEEPTNEERPLKKRVTEMPTLKWQGEPSKAPSILELIGNGIDQMVAEMKEVYSIYEKFIVNI